MQGKCQKIGLYGRREREEGGIDERERERKNLSKALPIYFDRSRYKNVKKGTNGGGRAIVFCRILKGLF